MPQLSATLSIADQPYMEVRAVTTCSTVSTMNDALWFSWVTGGTQSTATYYLTLCNQLWNAWIAEPVLYYGTSGMNTAPIMPTVSQPPRYDAAQADTQQLLREIARAERRVLRDAEEAEALRKHAAEQEAADDRARALLEECLSIAQLASYRADGHFEVVTRSRRRYRLQRRYGAASAVYEVSKDGHDVASYCIHPAERVPQDDCLLAQKLLLEADEGYFRRTANRTPLAARVEDVVPQSAVTVAAA